MARKAAISLESLTKLGAKKLAELVLSESGNNAPFRKKVSAALAADKGPEAVAKIVDRRLSALEKARSFIDWDKARGFRDDLAATVEVAYRELGNAAPMMGVDRLLRFVATHEEVFCRVDDSGGKIQDVYEEAIENIGTLTGKLTPQEMTLLPDKIMAALGTSRHGYLPMAAEMVVEHLPEDVLVSWEQVLAKLQEKQEAAEGTSKARFYVSIASQYRDIRQMIALQQSDLDAMIAIEEAKSPNTQNTLGIAQHLLNAGRAEEALEWVRKEKTGGLKYTSFADLADNLPARETLSFRKVTLEAEILNALGQGDAAQSLRWSYFEAALEAECLRDYMNALPDFEEFDALDRAFDHVLASGTIHRALHFFLEWPKLDLAARLVIANRDGWDGRQYQLLPVAAEALEQDFPLAAAFLYRALIYDVLDSGRSKAYGHAAGYLMKLEDLAGRSDPEAAALEGAETHASFRAGLKKKHGRKYGFWSKLE